ncbi:MAG: hypothetical protein CMM01_26510 [Rhodopirellula sp.]|nr:hypothetical protein [Rhodopirellula sp.]
MSSGQFNAACTYSSMSCVERTSLRFHRQRAASSDWSKQKLIKPSSEQRTSVSSRNDRLLLKHGLL